MKHPVLTIKKSAERYDDTRPDRRILAAEHEDPDGGADSKTRRRGLLRSALRPGRSLLLPLVIVVIAVLAFSRFLRSTPPDHALLAGWEVALRALPYQGALLATVSFTAADAGAGAGTASAASAASAETTAIIRFVLPDTGLRLQVSTPLGGRSATSPSATARGQLDLTGREKILQAFVSIGRARTTLSVPVSAVQSTPPLAGP